MKGKTFIIIFLLVLIGVFIMTGIVHKTVKSSGEKGLATEWNDDHEITGNIDQDQNQFLNAVIENRTDFPAGPVEGQIIYRSDLNALYIYNGTTWTRTRMGTLYWSCSGINFKAQSPDTDDIWYDELNYWCKIQTGPVLLFCPVFLPQGAIVTAVKVFGNAGASGDFWYFDRTALTDASESAMASANVNVEDTTITNAVIDNSIYSYSINIDNLDTNDLIYGARITYIL